MIVGATESCPMQPQFQRDFGGGPAPQNSFFSQARPSGYNDAVFHLFGLGQIKEP